jgi:hypothetical protein
MSYISEYRERTFALYKEYEKELPKGVHTLVGEPGRDLLGDALDKSDGAAHVIIHPYHPEWDGSIFRDIPPREPEYRIYERKLHKVAREADAPIIIYEHVPSLPDLVHTVDRLGSPQPDVFLVPTFEADPTPVAGSISYMNGLLVERGLKSTHVSGSYLNVDENSSYPDDQFPLVDEIPEIARNGRLSGCVGLTIETYLEAGIAVTPTEATYSRQRKHI